MWLALRLIVRLVGVVALCLAFAVAWAMVDTHRSIDRETAASADRVAAQLEILYWRELLWRGGLRKERLLPAPEWQTLATLKLVSAGVCVAFAPGTGEPTRLCGQVEGVARRRRSLVQVDLRGDARTSGRPQSPPQRAPGRRRVDLRRRRP